MAGPDEEVKVENPQSVTSEEDKYKRIIQEFKERGKEGVSYLTIGEGDNKEALVFPNIVNISGKQSIFLLNTHYGALRIDMGVFRTPYAQRFLNLINERFGNKEESEKIKSSINKYNDGRKPEDKLQEGIFKDSDQQLRFRLFDPGMPTPNKFHDFPVLEISNPLAARAALQQVELNIRNVSQAAKPPEMPKM